MERFWRCIIPPQQWACWLMTFGVGAGVLYSLADIIDLQFTTSWFATMYGDSVEGLALWKRNYGIREETVGDFRFYYTSSPLIYEVYFIRLAGELYPDERCPCRYRDGYSPPVPIC